MQKYIDDFIVFEKYRNKGYGKRLLQYVEDAYKGKGFHNINLVTNAFQAPGFYEKMGFTLEFVRENKNNKKLDKYFYCKLM